MGAVLWIVLVTIVGFILGNVAGEHWLYFTAPGCLMAGVFFGVLCGVWAFWYAHTGRLARLWRKV